MTGGAEQLIVNMTKTGCCYYYFLVLSRLAYCMTWGRARNHFFIIIFSAERAYTPVIFGCAFCRLSVNGARHNNEPAHRHKK